MYRVTVVSAMALLVAGLVACDRTHNPESGTPVDPPAVGTPSPTAAATASPMANPPRQLTLWMVPLNPADFSMEAIQASKKRVEDNPKDVEALIALGNANFMIQRFEVTQEMLSRAVKEDPKLIDPRLTLSTSKYIMRDVEGSIKELDELLKIEANNPEALYNKGLIQLQTVGDRTAAKGTWTQLVQSHPEHDLSHQIQDVLAKL